VLEWEIHFDNNALVVVFVVFVWIPKIATFWGIWICSIVVVLL
jgi:hypothetical protein